jgi:type II secretory pathway component GspD/PulD (secretin)
LRKKTGLTESSPPDEYLGGFSKLLSTSGTTLPPTSIWLEQGLLLVRGTPQQLDAVEQTVLELNGFPSRKPQEGANSGTIMDKAYSTPAETGHSTNLETRTFKVDPNTFYSGLQSLEAQNFVSADSSGGDHHDGGGLAFVTNQTANISLAARQFFTTLGLNLDPPKSIFFNDRLGVLFVRATGQDLDTVEKVVQVLTYTPPPQIHIKARFIEVPEDSLEKLGNTLDLAFITNNGATVPTLLAPQQTRTTLQTFGSKPGFVSLAEPEVTTLSDRQTQMRATEIISVMNGINPQARLSPGVSATNVLQITPLETGPVLDVIPHLMADGYTFDLEVTASLTEFMGYDERGKTNIATVYVEGRKQQVNIPMPQITTRELKTDVRVRDGQTVVLGGGTHETIVQHKEQVSVAGSKPTGESRVREQATRTVKKQLLVLITATLVDAGGNRIHSDDEMLIARPGIPPQDSR